MAFRDRTPLYYYSQSSECRHVNNERLQREIFTIQISIIKYITPNKTAPFTEQFLVFLFIFCAHFYLIIARKNSLMKRNWGLLSRFEIPNVPPLNFKCILVGPGAWSEKLFTEVTKLNFIFKIKFQLSSTDLRFEVFTTFSTEFEQFKIYSVLEVFVSHQCFEN